MVSSLKSRAENVKSCKNEAGECEWWMRGKLQADVEKVINFNLSTIIY